MNFVLYGIAVVGNERMALLGYTDTDAATKRREEKVKIFKEGDSVRNAKVNEIRETSVTLEVNEEPLTLNVYDPKDPKARRQNRTPSVMREVPLAPAVRPAASSSNTTTANTTTAPPPSQPLPRKVD